MKIGIGAIICNAFDPSMSRQLGCNISSPLLGALQGKGLGKRRPLNSAAVRGAPGIAAVLPVAQVSADAGAEAPQLLGIAAASTHGPLRPPSAPTFTSSGGR